MSYLYFLQCDNVNTLQTLKSKELVAIKARSCYPHDVRKPVNLLRVDKRVIVVALYEGQINSSYLVNDLISFYPHEGKFKSLTSQLKAFYREYYSLLVSTNFK